MNRPDAATRRGVALASLSGLLLALSFPLADLGALAFVALVPLLISLRGCTAAGAILRGYACGGIFFAVLLYWIVGVTVTYGGLPAAAGALILALMVFYLATYVALFALLTAASWRRFGARAIALAPVGWVGLELLRGSLLTGFPWGGIGYSQHANLALLQTAAFGGIHAVSFLVVAANAAAALLIAGPRRRLISTIAVGLAALVAAAHVAGAVRMRSDPGAGAGERVAVAAIQGNVPQERKWDPGEQERILSDLERLTRAAAAGGAAIVVWPESSSPLSIRLPIRGASGRPDVAPNTPYLERLGALTRGLEVTLVAGTVDYGLAADGRLEAYNSAVVVGPDGAIGPTYAKTHLVPFGEYVPLARLLFFVDRMVEGSIADFAPGERLAPLPTPAGPAATFICYEAIFPGLVRRLAGDDATFLVNITNDAWFGNSAAPHQHLAMARARAVESGRFLARAANTGISAFVDPHGRITSRTGLFEPAFLVDTIAPRRGATPYVRAGDVLAWGCAILTLLHAAALRAAFSRPAAPSDASEPRFP